MTWLGYFIAYLVGSGLAYAIGRVHGHDAERRNPIAAAPIPLALRRRNDRDN